MIDSELVLNFDEARPTPASHHETVGLDFSLRTRAQWLLPSVEAVTAVMCSAAPLEFKIRAACAALVDHAMASGAWVMAIVGEKMSVLACESEDEDLHAIVNNTGLNDMLVRRMQLSGHASVQTFEPVIVRSFDALGVLRDFVAAPLAISGRVVGMLTCLFRPELHRADQELQAVEIIARIFAMALHASAIKPALSCEPATLAVNAFVSLSRPVKAVSSSPDHMGLARADAIIGCLPGSVVIFNTNGVAVDSVAGSSLTAGLPMKNAGDEGWLFNFSTTQALFAQQEAVRKALQGEQSTCQFQIGDWSGSNDAHRIIEQTFSAVKNASNEVVEVVAYVHDVTEKVTMGERLQKLQQQDSVTDCMSFDAFMDAGKMELLNHAKQQTSLVFYTIEIEKTGAGIHLLGQSSYKELLQTVVSRIRQKLPRPQFLTRRGDHSFLAIARCSDAGRLAQACSQKIIESLGEPIVTGRHEYFIATNVGFCVFPQDGQTLDELIYSSDIAAIAAAREKINHALAFSPHMAQEANERVRIETALHRAVDHEEFKLAFQPKVDLLTGNVSGVEALIRWPGRGNMSPAQFIPIAEDCGLISFVGEWALRQACKAAANWARQGRKIPVSVNVSSRQFQDHDFNSIVQDALRDTGCDAGLLEIEVTEGVMIRDPQAALRSFKELKKLGITLSIDDFGTGYSSLAYLKALPVDKLKIDRAFVKGLPEDKSSEAIVKAILAMAQAMGLRTIAEGVEELDCLQHLRLLGCDEIQGYYFSKPLFEDDFMAWFDAYQSVQTVNHHALRGGA